MLLSCFTYHSLQKINEQKSKKFSICADFDGAVGIE